MMSRGFLITLTGLVLLGGAPAAFAQPEPAPVPVPAPVVRAPAPDPGPQLAPTPVPTPVPHLVPHPVPHPVMVQTVPTPVPWPQVDVPHVVMPPVEIPSFEIPQFEIPHFDPQFEVPHFDMPHFEMPHFEMPHVEFPHVEFPHVEFPQVDVPFELAQMPFKLAQIDPVEISEAMEKARKAIEKVEEVKPFRWDADQIRKDVDRAKAGMELARELADAKVLTMSGISELHLPRFGQAQTAQIVRMFQGCDSWRGSGNNEEVEDRYYDCGRNAVDQSQWDRAVDYFGRAAAAKGDRADGALYWKAWSQNRLGQRAEALTTLSQLKSLHAKSRWVNDASALEVEIRQRTGQSVDPATTQDDELQLIALNALRDKPSAVPMLEKFLQGPRSPKLKERALFVLAQNESPSARAALAKVAKGEANPELQLKAVQYLGNFKSAETSEILSQAYKTSGDAAVKRAVLRAYSNSHDRERLLAAARSETDATLRGEAVRQLGNMQATAELADLYGRESSADVKKQILRALANSGQSDRLAALAQTEQDPELKRSAIRAIGQNRNAQTSAQLTGMYDKDSSRVVREAVIDALYQQQNGAALVSLARREKDPELKRRLVERLSNMRDNAEAEAYMLELLK